MQFMYFLSCVAEMQDMNIVSSRCSLCILGICSSDLLGSVVTAEQGNRFANIVSNIDIPSEGQKWNILTTCMHLAPKSK